MLRALPVVVLLLAAAASGALALRGEASPAGDDPVQEWHKPYDGRFTFVRLRFDAEGPGMGYSPPWSHDYPRAERNFMRILDFATLLAPRMDGGNILELSDPELAKYPLAYLCEPGFWRQTEEEAEALRNWLLKGGFLIFDDFRGGDIYNFEEQLRRVLPGTELVELTAAHPIFHSFFEIESLDLAPPTYRRFTPAYYGVFQDNDPSGRLLAVVNYNNDIGDYWEYSDTGWLPVDVSNEAYKLGVNYVVYAMTH
jgi:hypothetical protein